MAIDAKAKAMQRSGIDMVSFGAGEPDFPTPAHVKASGMAAIDANFTKYPSPVTGIPELRAAIAKRLQEDDGLHFAPEQIVVSPGAKETCYLICQVLLQEGDEAIIPAPYWVSYAEQVRLSDAQPVIVPTHEQDGFKLRPADLAAAITPRTRLLILNSPCNPTGAVYSPDELRALGEVLRRHPDVVVLSDEIYKKINYVGGCASTAAVLPDLADRLVLVDGASKAYSMTGWRIGFAAGPQPLIKAMGELQSHSTSGAASISQRAAADAFGGDQSAVETMRAQFQHRRDFVVDALNKVPGFRCASPDGAFYAFPNVAGALGRTVAGQRIETSLDLANFLLDHAHVAVVPGEAFGAPGYLRLSYACSLDQIKEGTRRMREALAEAGAAAHEDAVGSPR
jgi:aspartate aminotransferase